MQESALSFDEEKIKILTLSDLFTVIDVALEKNYIKTEEKDSVFEWLENPEFWEWK